MTVQHWRWQGSTFAPSDRFVFAAPRRVAQSQPQGADRCRLTQALRLSAPPEDLLAARLRALGLHDVSPDPHPPEPHRDGVAHVAG